MHVPPRNVADRYIAHMGGHDAMARSIEEEFPGSTLFEKELDQIEIEGKATDRSP